MLKENVKNQFTKFFVFAMKSHDVFNLLKERFIDVSMFNYFISEKQFELKTNTFNHDFFDILIQLNAKTEQ